jgi:threonyl-tRNA synthetase
MSAPATLLSQSPQGAPCVGAVLHYHLIALERLMALLFEQPAKSLPLWLAPEQLRLLTVSPREIPYATSIIAAAQEMGVRAYLDATSVPLDRKIFRAERATVPLIAIIGAGEVQRRALALRSKRQRSCSLEHFLALLPSVSRPSQHTIEEFKSRLESQ